MTTPSPELIRQLIHFDGQHYFWKPRPRSMFVSDRSYGHWNAEFAGKQTMLSPPSNDYAMITIREKNYQAHRVIWAFHYGEWPIGCIDHINGDKTDNRLCNLRVTSHAENMKNQKRRSTNTSGVTGVCWSKKDKRWVASIKVDGRSKHLGSFAVFDAAVSARKLAETNYGYHPNHGRVEGASA